MHGVGVLRRQRVGFLRQHILARLAPGWQAGVLVVGHARSRRSRPPGSASRSATSACHSSSPERSSPGPAGTEVAADSRPVARGLLRVARQRATTFPREPPRGRGKRIIHMKPMPTIPIPTMRRFSSATVEPSRRRTPVRSRTLSPARLWQDRQYAWQSCRLTPARAGPGGRRRARGSGRLGGTFHVLRSPAVSRNRSMPVGCREDTRVCRSSSVIVSGSRSVSDR